ncbi:MAG: hypothetical protein IJ867_06500 [Clostridia bacterium]|nr:hypothetical protein [Clostridia bacterium]
MNLVTDEPIRIEYKEWSNEIDANVLSTDYGLLVNGKDDNLYIIQNGKITTIENAEAHYCTNTNSEICSRTFVNIDLYDASGNYLGKNVLNLETMECLGD